MHARASLTHKAYLRTKLQRPAGRFGSFFQLKRGRSRGQKASKINEKSNIIPLVLNFRYGRYTKLQTKRWHSKFARAAQIRQI